MRIWPECFRGGQHDRLRHDRGRLTPLVGGTRSQLLLGTDQVSMQQLDFDKMAFPRVVRQDFTDTQAYQRRARPGDSTGVGGVSHYLSHSRNTDIDQNSEEMLL